MNETYGTRPETSSDEDIVRAAQLGWAESVDELYERFERRIFACAHKMVAPAEVEDAVQEIALRMIKSLPTFRGDSSVATWIYSVARHTCLDVRRRRRSPSEPISGVDDLIPGDEVLPDQSFEHHVMACRTALAIRDLPESQQEVVLSRLGEGLSTEDTAAHLGVSQDAVKARLRRARSTLRESLTEYLECPMCGPGSYSVGPGVLK